ncbi:hypothetical protein [Methylovorus sp. MP688]|uniref:hypothetical protein n=1 Tax=Methylovorus sp. (strain MP688) TaxID=887061 RepID=UPI0001EC4FCE|nr:hypothetical protein [Methylovorus sp. MP688]ADQ85381.1 conserved hypothetical protein [Methylovorus sp. MP688]
MRRWFSDSGASVARFASALAAFCLLLSSPAWADSAALTQVLQQKPTLEGFDMCYGGGCAAMARITLSAEEWQRVVQVFTPTPENAAAERVAISHALGEMEQMVGAKTGTSVDKAGTFGVWGKPGQLDCNDEAANSTAYMKLMLKEGLIRFHDILDTKRRGFFLNGWPHTTAAILDRASGERFAVDSWFYDNGQPAVIVPLEQWKSGWKPENSPAR